MHDRGNAHDLSDRDTLQHCRSVNHVFRLCNFTVPGMLGSSRSHSHGLGLTTDPTPLARVFKSTNLKHWWITLRDLRLQSSGMLIWAIVAEK